MLAEARDVIAALPPGEVGTCVLDAGGGLYHGNPGSLADALARGALRFHRGSIRGSIPKFIDR